MRIYTHEGTTYGARDEPDLTSRTRAAGTFMIKVAESIRARGVSLPIVSLGAARVLCRVRRIATCFPDMGALSMHRAG